MGGGRGLLLMLAAALPQAGHAAIPPDPRIATVEFAGEGLTRLRTSPGTTQTVLFEMGERISSVILSDPDAYLVTVSPRADSMTLCARNPSALVIMTVQTDGRRYQLELVPDMSGMAPQVMRFSYGGAAPAWQSFTPPRQSPQGVSWRLSGDKMLRPASINDDGSKTYIAWDNEQLMPAVFVVAEGGREESVDGYVRAGVFTIDRVYPQLIFRIDDHVAKARRIVAKPRKVRRKEG